MLLFLLFAVIVAADPWGFTSPSRFDRDIWSIGDTQTVEWYPLQWNKFTIALWQESGTQRAATRAAIVFDTADGLNITSFEWKVQIYDKKLEMSDKFFFWAFEGNNISSQGNQKLQNAKSNYFTIRNAPPPSSAVTPASSTSTIASPPNTSASDADESNQDKSDGSDGSSGLSSGAAAGIAVAATLAVVALIGGLVLWYRRHHKKAAPGAQAGRTDDQAVLVQAVSYEKNDLYPDPRSVPPQPWSWSPPPQELWNGSPTVVTPRPKTPPPAEMTS